MSAVDSTYFSIDEDVSAIIEFRVFRSSKIAVGPLLVDVFMVSISSLRPLGLVGGRLPYREPHPLSGSSSSKIDTTEAG